MDKRIKTVSIIKEEAILQNLLDSANVEGTILIYNQKEDTYHTNSAVSSKMSFLPASTFKIPNTVIGLESGVLQSCDEVFEWDGRSRAFSFWEKDLVLGQAFKVSCVPCYQELARDIGLEQMQEYVEKLEFGDMRVEAGNLDDFWIVGESRVSPFQQIDFLERLYDGRLPISKSTSTCVKSILTIGAFDDYELYGKTGLVVESGKKDVGWFVGCIVKEDGTFFFASRLSPKIDDFNRGEFLSSRKMLTIKGLQLLHIVE